MSYVVYQMMGVAPKALEDMREERYKVAVLTMEKGEVIEEQSLILPLTEARLLCASMATDDTLPSLLVRGQNAWYDDQHNAALPGLAQVIACMARRMRSFNWLWQKPRNRNCVPSITRSGLIQAHGVLASAEST